MSSKKAESGEGLIQFIDSHWANFKCFRSRLRVAEIVGQEDGEHWETGVTI